MSPFEYSFFFNYKICSLEPHSPVALLASKIFNQFNTSSIKIEIKKLALNNILSNLFIAHRHGRCIVISKSPNTYTNFSWYGLYHSTFRIIMEWIEILIGNGYINQRVGFYDKEKAKGKRSRIIPSEKLIFELNNIENRNKVSYMSLKYSKNIILKGDGLIKYKPSGKMIGKKKLLDEYNEFISGSEIIFPYNQKEVFFSALSRSYDDSSISLYHLLDEEASVRGFNTSNTLFRQRSSMQSTLTVPEHTDIPLLITLDTNSLLYKEIDGQLYRVFNDGKFTRGGRYYGSHYQQLNEKDRAKIIINGSPIVEVDYSGFHLNMLYHLNGKQFNGDPYSAVDRQEVRDILKVLCLIVINSKDNTQALRALRDVIRKDWKLKKLKLKYQLDEKILLSKFESVHADISSFFCSGVGLKLMYIDSEMAETILKYFALRNIPCLCVHDSFLVPVQHKDELKEVMKNVYKKRIGFEPKLK